MTIGLPLLAANTLLNPRQRRPGALAQRLGFGSAKPTAPVIWLHAASNGEVTSARPVIDRILSDHADCEILLTVHTTTGYDLALSWNLARVSVRMAPYDVPLAISAVLRRWSPILHITVENEAWPNRILACNARGVPCWYIGARLSERSHAGWKSRAPRLARRVFGALDRVWPQDEASAARFQDLGVSADRISPVESLKSFVKPGALPSDFGKLSSIFNRAHTVLAASTHAGEEVLVIRAFQQAQTELPHLRLILAPRHPRRAPEVVAELEHARLSFAQRSLGQEPGRDTDVYLADKMGEMTAWYRLSSLAFVGGSLVDMGGHTPYEPAMEGCAIAHGPYLSNQADAYRALKDAGATFQVHDASTLAQAFIAVASPDHVASQAVKAHQALFDGSEGRVAAEVSSELGEILKRFA